MFTLYDHKKASSYSVSILGGQSFPPFKCSFVHVVLGLAFLRGGMLDDEVLEAAKEVGAGPGWEALCFLATDTLSAAEIARRGLWTTRESPSLPTSSGVTGLEVALSK